MKADEPAEKQMIPDTERVKELKVLHDQILLFQERLQRIIEHKDDVHPEAFAMVKRDYEAKLDELHNQLVPRRAHIEQLIQTLEDELQQRDQRRIAQQIHLDAVKLRWFAGELDDEAFNQLRDGAVAELDVTAQQAAEISGQLGIYRGYIQEIFANVEAAPVAVDAPVSEPSEIIARVVETFAAPTPPEPAPVPEEPEREPLPAFAAEPEIAPELEVSEPAQPAADDGPIPEPVIETLLEEQPPVTEPLAEELPQEDLVVTDPFVEELPRDEPLADSDDLSGFDLDSEDEGAVIQLPFEEDELLPEPPLAEDVTLPEEEIEIVEETPQVTLQAQRDLDVSEEDEDIDLADISDEYDDSLPEMLDSAAHPPAPDIIDAEEDEEEEAQDAPTVPSAEADIEQQTMDGEDLVQEDMLDQLLDDLEEDSELSAETDSMVTQSMPPPPAFNLAKFSSKAMDAPEEIEIDDIDEAPASAGEDHLSFANAALELHVIEGDYKGKIFPVANDITRIGRGSDNEIKIGLDSRVSRHHARIERRGNILMLVDNGSFNGSYVNGKRVDQQVLQINDEILIGQTRMILQRIGG